MKNLIAALMLGFLVACTGVQTKVEQPLQPDIKQQKAYRIGDGDNLTINVWRNQELSMGVVVRPDGYISMPLIGDLAARGKTAEELAKNIKGKLGSYIRNPEVTVIVASANSAEYIHRVRVTGAVRNPLSIPYRVNMTVLDLILGAGGTTDFAAQNKAKLYRTVKNKAKVYPVYLIEILEQGNLRTNYLLAPGDIVTVPERNF